MTPTVPHYILLGRLERYYMIVNFIDEYDESLLLKDIVCVPKIGETVIIDDVDYFVKNVVHEFDATVPESITVVLSEVPLREKPSIAVANPTNESAKAEQLANKALKEVKTLRNDFSNLRSFIKTQQSNATK